MEDDRRNRQGSAGTSSSSPLLLLASLERKVVGVSVGGPGTPPSLLSENEPLGCELLPIDDVSKLQLRDGGGARSVAHVLKEGFKFEGHELCLVLRPDALRLRGLGITGDANGDSHLLLETLGLSTGGPTSGRTSGRSSNGNEPRECQLLGVVDGEGSVAHVLKEFRGERVALRFEEMRLGFGIAGDETGDFHLPGHLSTSGTDESFEDQR